MIDKEYSVVDINSLVEDEFNANDHSNNLSNIEASIKEFGQIKPIVVQRETNIVVAGNGVRRAMLNLGHDKIRVVYTDLPLERALFYGIADNEIARKSNWILADLAKNLKAYAEWEKTPNWEAAGFTEDQIGPLLNAHWDDSDSGGHITPDDTPPDRLKSIKVTDDVKERFDSIAKVLKKQHIEANLTDSDILLIILDVYEREV